MATISKPYTFSAGATIVASEHNSNFDTIYNEFNGSISNANIDSSAAIADSKLAQITTAGKVSGAAVTLLTSLPSGAGIIPTANLGSGSASSSTFLRGDQTYAAPTPTAATSLSGSVVQTVWTVNQARSSGTTVVVQDSSAFANTEGNSASLDREITPNNSSNSLLIRVTVSYSFSANNGRTYIGLFQDSTTNALAVFGGISNDVADRLTTASFEYAMAAGTTSATTFKVRVGSTTAGTITFNDEGTTGLFAQKCTSTISILEIKA